jgi:transposase-like protein
MSQPLRMQCPRCRTEDQHRVVRTYPNGYGWPDEIKAIFMCLLERDISFRQRKKECRRCGLRFTTVEMSKLFLVRLVREVQRLQFRHYKPVEKAEVFQDRLDKGMSQKEIAEEFGYTPAHISQLLKLAKGPPEIKEAVKRRELTREEAVHAIRKQERSGCYP